MKDAKYVDPLIGPEPDPSGWEFIILIVVLYLIGVGAYFLLGAL